MSQPPDPPGDDPPSQGESQLPPLQAAPPPAAAPFSRHRLPSTCRVPTGRLPTGGAVAPPGMYFDQASGLNLPMGVELASIGRRIGAYFLSIPLAIVTLGIGYAIGPDRVGPGPDARTTRARHALLAS